MADKKKKTEHVILSVEDGSIAQELELEPGDVLVSIDGQQVEDIFDYRYLIQGECITVLIRKRNGEEWELDIEKEYDEDLGIDFGNGLMDAYRSCSNKCVFCFIDQLPKGMRETLYFKDDDSRLSFLQGNYITLTNMSDHDIDRIIMYHLEPINISFHTFNPALRRKMLNNRFAGDIFEKVDRLCEAGIELNGQIVLCKGINDGAELDYSLEAMERYIPCLKSLSVVPVGLTRFRDRLYPLEPFTKEDAEQVLSQIENAQKHFMEKYGSHIVHAGDEWYILAQREMPPEDNYDGYLQIENGVGMVRSLSDEVGEYLAQLEGDKRERKISVATGVLAYPYIRELADRISTVFPGVEVTVYKIVNRFFGERITVAGLLTGQDLKAQLEGHDLGENLLLTQHMLRSGEEVFLDDMTVSELSEALHVPVRIVGTSGRDLVEACIGK